MTRSVLTFAISMCIFYFSLKKTSITVRFSPSSDTEVLHFELQWHQMGQSWEQGGRSLLTGAQTDDIVATIDELLPNQTYALRISVIDKEDKKGIPGPEIVVDTDSISCTPKPRCRCLCVIS